MRLLSVIPHISRHSIYLAAFSSLLIIGCGSGGGGSGSGNNTTPPVIPETYAAGILDAAFGTGGVVITTVDLSSDRASALAVQSDGKIVAAGFSNNGTNRRFALVRYLADGSPDSAFGMNGIVTTDVSYPGDENATAVKIDSSGRIVAAGYANNGGTGYDFVIARYGTDGNLDNTFGTNGIVTTDVGLSSSDRIYSLAIDSNGKIVVAGYADIAAVVARYNTNGTLDYTFGTNGITTTAPASGIPYFIALAIQPDGKIVAAGSTVNNDFTAMRFNADGTPDHTFGTNGAATIDIASGIDSATALALQSDGRIVVAGRTVDVINGISSVAHIRFSSNGALDSTFGTNGITVTAIDTVSAIAVQSDGKIVSAGSTYNAFTGNDFVVTRFNTDGSLDSTFGLNGIVTADSGSSTDVLFSIAIQADNKIVAAGYTFNGGTWDDFAIVRYQ